MNIQVVEKIKLTAGAHNSIEAGACIMELVSYVAGEPWSDHPRCASPVVTSFAIKLNDRVNEEERQKLKTLYSKIIGTRDGNDKARADYLVLQSITVFLPLLTEALDLPEVTLKLRSFKHGEWRQAKEYIQAQRLVIRNAADAADAASAASAAYAAYAAAYAADAASASDAAYAASASASASADAAYAAAYAYAGKKSAKAVFWQGVRSALFTAAFKALEHVCTMKGTN